MTKAASLTLASTFTGQPPQLSADHLAPFYDEAVYTLGALPYLLDMSLVAVTQDQSTFTFPDTFLVLHEVWHDDRALDIMTHAELLALSSQWQEHRGPPLAYTEENLSLRQLRLYPIPPLPSDPLLMLHYGGAFGLDYPTGNVVMLATQFLQDLPSWLELPLILTMLAREYMLESPHQDTAFAQGCAQVSQLLMRMLPLPPIT